MPCSYEPTDAERAASVKATAEYDKSIRDKIDKLTRMLCGMCKRFDAAGYGPSFEKEVADWWKEHQEADRKREEKERRAKLKLPVKDLTDAELEAELERRKKEAEKAKARKEGCQFDVSWVGRCKQPVSGESEYCAKHQGVTCRCGKQAVRDCDATLGAFVCGTPMCGSCSHHH
jgi:hypothetical protein